MGSRRADLRWRSRQAGVTLPELLIGTALGLGVAALAVQWLADQTRFTHRLLAASRAQQELSSLSRLIESQARMAGHAPAWRPEPDTRADNPFVTVEATPQLLRLQMDRNGNGVLDITDTLTFLLNQDRLQLRIGNSGAQELNETAAVRITSFTPELIRQSTDGGTCVPMLRWTLSGYPPIATTPYTPLQIEGAVVMSNLAGQICP